MKETVRFIEKDNAILHGESGTGAIMGFSKPSLGGDPVHDMPVALELAADRFGICHMKQVHGTEIKLVEVPGQYICDGIFTRRDNIAMVVKTADCMPILFFSRKEGIIGAVHMGWRSAKDGILDNIGFDLSSFTVIAGVGMRKCCYRVGEEFRGYERFRHYLTYRESGYFFDPVSFLKNALMEKGMKEENFTDHSTCSYCSKSGFFSHRRNATKNRTLSFVIKNT
jgi:polyphenol oxidase